ncbi:ATPase family AAA domain-containing 1-A isoform X1 [Olea europaea subsp. europaea]|uniref:ATPase family AAA domain-containing 1-A isoform X1 n=1 Tax=Olea europaea subsp. europaea TaxID=158383 RepID=A0A8S0PUW4_OLEEU|nr:ATPase family AAA domain-containing 1-A isoform X1 [Olea europaea subsp. europaea]
MKPNSMASIRRLARTIRTCRTIAFAETLKPPSSLSPSPCLQLALYNRTFEQHKQTYGSQGPAPRSAHAILAGLLGFGLIDKAYADDNKDTAETSPPEFPPTLRHNNIEEIARKVKVQLQELIKSKGIRYGSYPRFTVAVKGQKVTIKFQVPSACEIPLLIANLVSRLGVKVEDNSTGSDMMLRAWDSGVSWQLTLNGPKSRKETNQDQMQGKDINANDQELCILMFRPLIGSDKAEIEFMKQGSFSTEELDALASVLQLAGQQKSLEVRPRGDASSVPSIDKTVSSLEGMGVKVYGLTQSNVDQPKADISWDNIAGYNYQKREIEDTILLALQSPEVYDDIARGTRCKFETNRPRAVLFEGPPGTGKTSCARVIANQSGVPMLYLPLEVIMSKYYGESERLLGKVFSLANEIPNGAIIFLDEVDSLATARDTETHEATRRMLSVLLRQIDGFEQEKKVVVVAATNRKQDLDPALLSRFDSMITFDLPDQQTRQEITAQYAKHLTKSELAEFASATEEMSGRDIRDVCQQAERHWASKIIRGQAQKKDEENGSLPPLQEYIESALARRNALLGVANQNRNPNPFSKGPQFDFLCSKD